jgi:hypothetical protein
LSPSLTIGSAGSSSAQSQKVLDRQRKLRDRRDQNPHHVKLKLQSHVSVRRPFSYSQKRRTS